MICESLNNYQIFKLSLDFPGTVAGLVCLHPACFDVKVQCAHTNVTVLDISNTVNTFL